MTTNNFHRRDDANTAPQSRFPVRELSLLVVLAVAVGAGFMALGSA